jgi:ABC-type uncharacterized transport system substrate-binding protein
VAKLEAVADGEREACRSADRAGHQDFVVNLSTAKTLGIPIPTSVLTRADEVIE